MKWAIYNGSSGTDYMGLNYYAYLKAMQSEFTFFLPSDEALKYYYDPTSFESTQKRLIQFGYKNQSFPITSQIYKYEPTTGEIGNKFTGSGATLQQQEITNRLKDILESHTIVHDGTNPIDGVDEYFLTKNGNAVRVVRENGHVVAVKGGFQIENERQGIINEAQPGLDVCNVTKPFESLKNGQTFILDSPIIPTYRSVYSIFTNDAKQQGNFAPDYEDTCPYAEFYKLCETQTDIVEACGLVDVKKLTTTEQKSAMKKYRVFVDNNGLDYNVQFFNNYHYTAFVPSNDAVKAAIAQGLPTWEEISEDYTNNLEYHINIKDSLYNLISEGTYTEQDSLDYVAADKAASLDSLRLQAKITYLTNFVRYHFADNTVFVDNSNIAEEEMVTSSYDKELGLFCKLLVSRNAGVLSVRDQPTGSTAFNIIYDNDTEKNVLARDVECSSSPVNTPMSTSSKKITLDASSACVIHRINGVLNHTALVNGRHDSTWATPESAKRCLKRYAILK